MSTFSVSLMSHRRAEHGRGRRQCVSKPAQMCQLSSRMASICDESPPYLITAPKGCILNHHLLTQGTAVPALEHGVSADLMMKSKRFG